MDQFKVKVKEVIRETSDAVSLVLDFPKINYKAGQFLTLNFNIKGQSIQRSYSLSSSPALDELPTITVKKVHNGIVSSYINDQISVGIELASFAPIGNFFIEPKASNARQVVMFGAGSGITPLMSMIKTLLALEPSSKVALVYCNSNENSIIFQESLIKLERLYPNRFQVIHILSKPSKDWVGLEGRVSSEMILQLIEQIPVIYPIKAEYYLCGPDGFMEIVKKGLSLLKVPSSNIFFESFNLVEAKESGATIDSEVTIKYRKSTYVIKVPAGKTILEAAQSAKVNIPYSCQGGVCSACMGKCISGKVKVSDEQAALSSSEIDNGYILTCLGFALTPTVEIVID